MAELNQKESKRLVWGAKILNHLGVKNIITVVIDIMINEINVPIKKTLDLDSLRENFSS